jgi:quinone-modifying oxidoreductase subunit QmoC
MANEYSAEPDLQFTKDLIKAGAEDLKKCYQCATCSVACRLAPDNNPFPRKEMIWGQWGMKDRLLNDPDVWLCFQCNDCSTQCPRGANPGDVLKAVRKMNIEENSWPSFIGKLVGSPSLFVLTLGIPVVIVLLLVYANNGFTFPTPIHYGEFISYLHMQIVFPLALLFAVFSMLFSLRRYWNQLEANNQFDAGADRKGFIPSLISALGEILPHTTFKNCEANNIRYSAHLLTFYGMIGLFITTAIVAFMIDILHLAPPSRNGPLTIPLKVLGNTAAAAFLIGLLIMVIRRLTNPDQAGNSSYFDWFFLFIIFGAGLTGLLTELTRWSGSVPGPYILYTIHLMFVLSLFLYLPFSKFAHLGYRTVAIAWGKSVGRNMTIPTEPNYVPPAPAATEESGETAEAGA